MSYRTAKKPILLRRGRNRLSRPKTFSSEEAAKKYADEKKIKKYTLKHLRPHSEKKKVALIVE